MSKSMLTIFTLLNKIHLGVDTYRKISVNLFVFRHLLRIRALKQSEKT